MIQLTHLDGRCFYINADLIQSFEATPETRISLTINKHVVVRESAQEVLAKVIAYKHSVFNELSANARALFKPPAEPTVGAFWISPEEARRLRMRPLSSWMEHAAEESR